MVLFSNIHDVVGMAACILRSANHPDWDISRTCRPTTEESFDRVRICKGNTSRKRSSNNIIQASQ